MTSCLSMRTVLEEEAGHQVGVADTDVDETTAQGEEILFFPTHSCF